MFNTSTNGLPDWGDDDDFGFSLDQEPPSVSSKLGVVAVVLVTVFLASRLMRQGQEEDGTVSPSSVTGPQRPGGYLQGIDSYEDVSLPVLQDELSSVPSSPPRIRFPSPR